MQDNNSLTQNPEEINEITIESIITAPESQWRELCALIDANPASMERMRARRQLQESDQQKPKHRSSRSRTSSSTKGWSAANVLHSQSAIAPAMAETLDRVNGNNDNEEKQTIWEKVLGIVNSQQDLGPTRQVILFKGVHKTVILFQDGNDRLRLIAKDGDKVLALSFPLAILVNSEWKWLKNAQADYKSWEMTIKACKSSSRIVRYYN